MCTIHKEEFWDVCVSRDNVLREVFLSCSKHNNSHILNASVLLTLSFSQDSSACLAKTASSTNNLSLFASLNKISYSNILYIGNLLGYALNTLESSGYGPFLSRFSSDQNNASVSHKY